MLINDDKLVKFVNDFNGAPVVYDCILSVTIEGLKDVNPELAGDAIYVEGAADTSTQDTVDKIADIADTAAVVLGGVFGDVADAIGGAADGVAEVDAAILTLSGTNICLYVFNKLASKIMQRITIPLEKVSRMKKSKLLLWHTVKFFYHDGSVIKLSITSKVPGIKKQTENLKSFIALLGERIH